MRKSFIRFLSCTFALFIAASHGQVTPAQPAAPPGSPSLPPRPAAKPPVAIPIPPALALPWAPAKYFLRTALSNRHLDVQNGDPRAGTPLQIWDPIGQKNQVWELVASRERGYFYIKSEMGRYLDVRGAGTAAGTPVHLWDFNGGDAQKWQLIPIDRQHFVVKSKLGNTLDVREARIANGTPVWTWPANGGAAQKWKFVSAGAGNALAGYTDLHTHPMSHLGFGRKAMHGVPGIDSIVPAGTRDCNVGPFRAVSIEQALGHCNSTHGGAGTDNRCGDYLRAAIINYALDDSFVHKVGFERNPHGDHEHAGYPDFKFWPHQSSILHQQMWWEWLERAHRGGLRVMVALTVNSELLAEILNGDGPYDDKSVADVQIDEMIRFAERPENARFMKIARSAAEVREIVADNKLAVVLGMEVDKIGNFGKPGVQTGEAAVRAEIRRLHGKGVRYVFPIHLIDNSFGGAAVYEMLFNFANKHANGYHFEVEPSSDPNVAYSAALTEGPIGSENALILGLRRFLEGIGELPAPCFCPLPKVRCCGSYDNIVRVVTPSPDFDRYKLIPGGHVNTRGLTPLGEAAINEMMKLGMLIDVDHMSDKSMSRSLQLAEQVPGGYPIVMGHNGLRGPGGNERGAPLEAVSRVAALEGLFGIGTSNTTPDDFIRNYRSVWPVMAQRGVAVGTDVNGFEPLPKHARQPPAGQDKDAFYAKASDDFYAVFQAQSGITSRQVTGTRTWDYIKDGGVSHYGLMPEFLFDVRQSGNGASVYSSLMESAEHFVQTWEKAERGRLEVR